MSAARKPRDIGNGLVCASFGAGGEWLSLATVDPAAGFVELTGLPEFDPDWRGVPDLVRRYRSWMRREEHAFLTVDAGRASVSTRQDVLKNGRGVLQRLVIRAPHRDRPAGIRIRLNGRLGWPTLAQLSEVDPPAEPGVKSRFKAREGTLRITGEGGPIIVQAWLRKGDDGATGSTAGRSDMRLGWQVLRRRMPTAVAYVDWPGREEQVFIDIACAFDHPPDEPPAWLDTARIAPPASDGPRHELRPLRVPARLVKSLGRMNRQAASYTRSCTALAVTGSERVILADHRILPLSRTRDAYWQARLLLSTWGRGGHDEDERIVADHLRWLFLRCERPDGRWLRSHYPDGRRKDHPFQADQQLYPLLELADYLSVTGRTPDLPPDMSWKELVERAWRAAEEVIDETSGLLRTEENAADVVPANPYLLSDQILLWHVATRLASVAEALAIDGAPFTHAASRVREAVREGFVVEGPLGAMWAYAVNGRGGFERYMDANDLPVALAPLWGFCAPDDPVWSTTIRYAFDPENPGFAPGPAGGLGSRRTPGTWTLGDIMGWLAFGLMEDAAADAFLERLVDTAFQDGMLPEAFDPGGSGSIVRHWFAWPGAALGALLLEHSAREVGK